MHSAHSEHNAHSEHHEHNADSEHGAHSEHNAHIEHDEHSAHNEYSEHREHNAESEHGAHSEHSAHSEYSERSEHNAHSAHVRPQVCINSGGVHSFAACLPGLSTYVATHAVYCTFHGCRSDKIAVLNKVSQLRQIHSALAVKSVTSER